MQRDNVAEWNEIRALICAALGRFYHEDRELLGFGDIKNAVSERCMVFRIGLYLYENMMQDKTGRFAGLDIDCEYDRHCCIAASQNGS